MTLLTANVYDLEVGNETHCILQLNDNEVTEKVQKNSKFSEDVFNLAMIDISGSMKMFFDYLVKYWNKTIAEVLSGHTSIYTFGNHVYHVRDGTELKSEDFLHQGTNLTEAIKVINEKVSQCKQSIVKVILVTDGHHNETNIYPAVEIENLSIPEGKTVEFYLLGLGNSFPVEYSIQMRSKLHNGSSNVPALFWVECDCYCPEISNLNAAIEGEIMNIAELIKSLDFKIKIEPTCRLAPGHDETNEAFLKEYLYFSQSRSEISKILKVYDEDNELVNLKFEIGKIDIKLLLNKIFRQWNSIVIQEHRKNNRNLKETLDIMDLIFQNIYQNLKNSLIENDTSIKKRMLKKEIKYMETEFNTMMNSSRMLIGIEGKFASELELAQSILKTTVKTKYDTKLLKMRGHTGEDYEKDMQDFMYIYEKIKNKIMEMPEPDFEDCCRITMCSTVKDLKDEELLELSKQDKFTFMKNFTITGLPVLVKITDASQINPWTLHIDNILLSPFTIISQSVLEMYAEINEVDQTHKSVLEMLAEINEVDQTHKSVFLQEGVKETAFNAIIPVFTPEVVEILKPLLCSNIFSMLTTFCILKNEHVIDYNCHIASLACAWTKTIRDFPDKDARPEFIKTRLSLILATAEIFMGRKNYKKYNEILKNETNEALMTESSKLFDEKTLKCESLIKPLFFLYFLNKEQPVKDVETIFKLICLEFIGRCVNSQLRDVDLVYSQYFVPELDTKKKVEDWFDEQTQKTSREIKTEFLKAHGNLLKSFYKPEEIVKPLKNLVKKYFEQNVTEMFEYSVNLNKVNKYRNEASAGDLCFSDISKLCAEIKAFDDDTRQDIFGEEMIFIYIYHSIQNRNSKERLLLNKTPADVSQQKEHDPLQELPSLKETLKSPLATYEKALGNVKYLVVKENKYKLKKAVHTEVIKEVVGLWKKDYLEIHTKEIVTPHSRQQIIEFCKDKRSCCENNFDQIYRYNPKTGLLRNACMVKQCPFYLIPNRTFNQHISAERTQDFAHQLHQMCLKRSKKDESSATELAEEVRKNGYESQNGLKLPEVPPKKVFLDMELEINGLIGKYKNFTSLKM